MTEANLVEDVMVGVTAMKNTYQLSPAGRVQVMVRVQGITDVDQLALDDKRITAIFFDNYADFWQQRFFPLSQHEVVIDKQTGRTTFRDIIQGTSSVIKPTHCPVCAHLLTWNNLDGKCTWYRCPGQSRSCIREIVSPLLGEMPVSVLNDFLDNYLVGEQGTTIDNLFEFKKIVLDQNNFDKRTRLRLDQWMAFAGDIGRSYWLIECMYQDVLREKVQSSKHFWECCVFPNQDPKKIRSSNLPLDLYVGGRWLSPRDLVDGTPAFDAIWPKLNDWTKRLIQDNFDFIKVLLEVFENNGGVVWT